MVISTGEDYNAEKVEGTNEKEEDFSSGEELCLSWTYMESVYDS